MSSTSVLDIKKAIELQRRVLGEIPEVRNCRFDNNDNNDNANHQIEETKLIVKSAGQTVKYEGIPVITAEQQIELQRRILKA
jgi:hypothetical protein